MIRVYFADTPKEALRAALLDATRYWSKEEETALLKLINSPKGYAVKKVSSDTYRCHHHNARMIFSIHEVEACNFVVTRIY